MKQETGHPLVSDFLAKHAENVAKVQKEYQRNSVPYYAGTADGNSLSRVLQENLFKWRPWDRRRYLQFVEEDFSLSTTEFNKAMHQNFDVSVIGYEDGNDEGKIEAHILLNAKAGELRQYNELVDVVREQRRNQEEAKFDAATGTFTGSNFDATVHGGIPRKLKSTAKHVFQTPANVLQDDLLSGVQMPKADWRVAAIWLVTMRIQGETFQVTSVVTTVKGKVLSSIDLSGTDLSELGIQLMHRVFGNTVDSDKSADFYDGVRQLLAGEKSPGASASNCTAPAVVRKQGFFDRMGSMLIGLGALLLVFLVFFRGFNGSWAPYLLGVSLCLLGAIVPMFTAPLLEAKAEKDQARSIKV